MKSAKKVLIDLSETGENRSDALRIEDQRQSRLRFEMTHLDQWLVRTPRCTGHFRAGVCATR
jgi:hypothetical protein